jgi:putative ABC transport system permease protein
MALVMVMLVGAGLMLRSFYRLLAVNPGMNPENILTMQIWLPESRYEASSRVAAFYKEALQRIRALPGVESASAINFLPLSGWGDLVSCSIEDRARLAPGEQPIAQYRVVDPHYFHTLDIPILQGRLFTDQDADRASGVVIINETLARHYWSDESPLGKQIRLSFPTAHAPWRPQPNNAPLTIVGVAGDVREFGLGEPPSPQLYLPYVQNPSRLMRLVVRTTSEPTSLVASVRQAVWAVDKNQPISEVKSMERFVAESVMRRRFNLVLLSLFAALALILAAVGIYGVIAHAVSQRTREIGIRLALGARVSDVLRMVFGEGVKLTLIGVGVGLCGALAATRVLASFLFGVSASDPLTFISVSLILLAVALLACYLPARRATKVDPMAALRYE